MGQIEVYEWLKRQRDAGDERFFSAKEIYKSMKEEGLPVSNHSLWLQLCQLERFNYLEVRMSGKYTDWFRSYRFIKK